MTSKEALDRVKQSYYISLALWGIEKPDIETEKAIDMIEKDLEVLEILKSIVKIVDYSEYPITSLDAQLFILSGGMITNVEDYDKIKEWLNNENDR